MWASCCIFLVLLAAANPQWLEYSSHGALLCRGVEAERTLVVRIIVPSMVVIIRAEVARLQEEARRLVYRYG